MEDFTAAFSYNAPGFRRTRRDDSGGIKRLSLSSLSLQNNIWSWSPTCGIDGSGSLMSDIDRRGTLQGISMPVPAPPCSPLCYYGGGSSATMRVRSGSGASSSAVNWATQETLLGHHTTTSQGPARSCPMLNLGSYNNGMASRRAFNFNLISHLQPSLNSADFEALEHSDILRLGMDKSGSLSLQNALSWGNMRVTNKIFEAVVVHVFDLINNQYGHHLYIKLIESCNGDQLQRIIVNVTAQSDLFYNASININGSQSIKKLIKLLTGSPLISFVIIALCSRLKEIMNDKIGKYVVMQCFETLDDEQNKLLYEAVINNFRSIAVTAQGCISLGDLINDVRGPFRQQLLNLVFDHLTFLSKDPYGNFVVQRVIGLQNPDLTDKICSELQGKYVELSMLKYGSHVVEKCLKSPGMARYVVTDFLSSDKQLLQVARHKYGNYAIQTALKVTKNEHSPLHQDLLSKLRGLKTLQVGHGRIVYNLIVNGVPN
ncbi:hypothetical protein Dsin_012799 [Dipteronia sinensis]|uniref:PUM-HD domain-containing protein n=1 Tax=Dipteronia sinensis TaxID=43782 RepID=A0AAE0E8I4_9ROSI|nr:hypothetical protein Dsin_012799 [Dipteronia sinensis]